MKVCCLAKSFPPKKFSNQHLSSGGLKGHLWALKDTSGHFQYVSVPWTCEFVPHKKFSNQHLSGKNFSASCLDLQRCFASSMPTKVLKRSQRTLVGTFNVFLCLGHVNCPTKKFSNQNLSVKKLSASCLDLQRCFASSMPTKVLKGLKGHLWALSICFCALDM